MLITRRHADELVQVLGPSGSMPNGTTPATGVRRLVAEFTGVCGLVLLLAGAAAVLNTFEGASPPKYFVVLVLSMVGASWLIAAIFSLGDVPAIGYGLIMRGVPARMRRDSRSGPRATNRAPRSWRSEVDPGGSSIARVDDASIAAWGGDAVPLVSRLWAAAMPDEPIGDAVLAGIFEPDPGVLLATADGLSLVAVVTRETPASVRGYVRLLLVHPDVRRRGRGLALMQAAEKHLAECGAESVTLGGEAPVYLWPGIDTANLAALALADHAGFRDFGAAINLAMPTATYRHAPPEAVSVDVVASTDAARGDAVRDLVARHWPAWSVEVDRALRQGTLVGAFTDLATPVGFCSHSTMREGWLGPLGTDPAHRKVGIASALVSAALEDMNGRGFSTAEVAWVGIPGWFADRGATLARTFRRYRKSLQDV